MTPKKHLYLGEIEKYKFRNFVALFLVKVVNLTSPNTNRCAPRHIPHLSPLIPIFFLPSPMPPPGSPLPLDSASLCYVVI
jgi:hypothetical protein